LTEIKADRAGPVRPRWLRLISINAPELGHVSFLQRYPCGGGIGGGGDRAEARDPL